MMLRLFWLCVAAAILLRFHAAFSVVLGVVFRNFHWIVILTGVFFFIRFVLKGYLEARAKIGASRSSTREPPNATETVDDPWQVLGIAKGASDEEIKKAYREQLLKYHPDRVTHLGQEFQDMAHEKAIEIERAYRALCP